MLKFEFVRTMKEYIEKASPEEKSTLGRQANSQSHLLVKNLLNFKSYDESHT